MNRTQQLWLGLVIILALVIALLVWLLAAPASPFPVDPADHLTSWQLPTAQDIASTSPQINADIATLKGETGKYPAENLDLGIANGYALLGDGKSSYQYYIKALVASSTYSLPYENMGALFAELHATSTAKKAYAKAVELMPQTELYQLAYLQYLARVEPTAPSTVSAFASAKTALGSTTPDLLITEASWLGAIGNNAAAIADWLLVRDQVQPAQRAAVDARIAALRAAQ